MPINSQGPLTQLTRYPKKQGVSCESVVRAALRARWRGLGIEVGMVQRILDRKALGGRSRQEVVVSSDEGRGREVLGLDCLARAESRGQLDSIIPAQAVAL